MTYHLHYAQGGELVATGYERFADAAGDALMWSSALGLRVNICDDNGVVGWAWLGESQIGYD